MPEGLEAEDELIKETMQRPQGFSRICPLEGLSVSPGRAQREGGVNGRDQAEREDKGKQSQRDPEV